MTDSPEVAAARIEVARARGRLLDSLRAFESPLVDLKRQLTPRHIVSEIVDGAKEKGADLAEDAVDAVKARPLAATGVVAAITMYLAREPLMDLAGWLLGSVSGKDKAKRKDTGKSKRPKTVARQHQTEATS